MFITWLRLVSLLAAVDCGDLCDPDAVRWYAKLNAASSLNRHSAERAAFVVRRPQGGLMVIMWQAGEAAEATYKGRVPAGTIAIAHTHPRTTPEPSRKDLLEAQRLGFPIVVITPARVSVARSDGTVTTLFGPGWTKQIR